MSLPDSAKIWLRSVKFFLPKCCPQDVDLSVGDIPQQIEAEWLETTQWSQQTAYKPPSLF